MKMRSAFIRVLGILVAILLSVSQADAVVRYVDQLNGNDQNDGLSAGQALQNLGSATNVLLPGDTLMVMPGVYCSGSLATFLGSITTTTLTITTLQSGTVQTGALSGPGVTAGSRITAGSGTSWTITPSQTVAAGTAMYINQGLGSSNCGNIPQTASGVYNPVRPTDQTTNAAKATGQTILTTSTNPVSGGVLVGDMITDATNPTALLPGATVTAVATNSVTISPPVYTTSVSSGDTLQFSHACTSMTTIMGYLPTLTSPLPVIRGERGAFSGIYGGGIHCVTIKNLEFAGWNDVLTLASAWTNASTGATAVTTAQYNASGINIDDGVAPTNQTASGTVAAGQTVIATSTNPVTGGVSVGDVVYDSTNTAALQSGSTVAARTTTSVTVTPAISAPGISTSDTLKFWHAPHHIVISNTLSHDWPCGGIAVVRADYLWITGNWVYGNGLWSPNACSGISAYEDYAIDTLTMTKHFINGNVGYNNVDNMGNYFAGVQGTVTAAAGIGTSTLTFTSRPNVSNTNGTQVYNTTAGNSGSIQPGTTVASTTGSAGAAGTIVLSLPITAGSGSGVGNGNTFQFSTITDGEGIFIDDNINDQGSMNLPYPGRTQVQNNIAVGSGNCGVCQYKSGHVDFSFNTTYNNMTSNPVPEQGEMSDSQGTDTNFYYNLMINTGTHAILPDLSASTTTYAYNAGNGAGTMSGTNNVTATLNLVNTTIVMPTPTLPPALINFQVIPGSPAIDAVPSSPLFTRATDILGNPGLAGPNYDMGAYESPCSTYGANPIQPIATAINTLMASGQPQNSITPQVMRQIITTLWCGRSPYVN